MNVMKNWGCLNKIKLVGILLAGEPYFIFHPVVLPPRYFFVYAPPKSAPTRRVPTSDNIRYAVFNEEKSVLDVRITLTLQCITCYLFKLPHF